MKGKLITKEGKWFVYLQVGKYEEEFMYKELPLHPDDVLQLDDAMLYPEGYSYYNLLKFEIIEKGTGIYFGGLQSLDTVGGKGVQESTIQYAKIIQSKEISSCEDGFDIIRGDKESNKVTRLEVIDHSENGVGRAYTKYDIKSLELSYQDDGRTLKIFIK
jgi:hypothetical protein